LLKKLRLTGQRPSAPSAHDCQAVARCQTLTIFYLFKNAKYGS